jgi:hypothetical protein
MSKHIHQELNEEITAIGGAYTLVKEVRLPFEGREILYIVGHAAFDSTCCGVSGCAYALVPGFILDWKANYNTNGLPVSQVESVQTEAAQASIRKLIFEQEIVHQVQFL